MEGKQRQDETSGDGSGDLDGAEKQLPQRHPGMQTGGQDLGQVLLGAIGTTCLQVMCLVPIYWSSIQET